MPTNKTIYRDCTNGNITTNQHEAMEWYRQDHEIIVYSWSETAQQIVERVRWEV